MYAVERRDVIARTDTNFTCRDREVRMAGKKANTDVVGIARKIL